MVLACLSLGIARVEFAQGPSLLWRTPFVIVGMGNSTLSELMLSVQFCSQGLSQAFGLSQGPWANSVS